MSEAPFLSVVIVSWNVREDLWECLRSLWRNGEGLAMEVIVVDNASDDGTAEMVRQEFPQVRLEQHRHPPQSGQIRLVAQSRHSGA
jgi:GT2 family glycosyltransferase